MIKEPETRPISQEQLVAEVKGIHAGLVIIENKCIEVDNEQWQALVALHRVLLHEHHDFLLASQHPSASPALRRLASKYAMPARMWRHGIHSFLELLRHRLPASLEHMLTFIHLAYSMITLLYETVPAFEDTWIECLVDLGCCRLAIEYDYKERARWKVTSRHWVSKASDKDPTTGRLYKSFAILAGPNALFQLFYYAKSLCVPIPFLDSRESMMALFSPHLNGTPTRLREIDAAFVLAHGILFTGTNRDQLAPVINKFICSLDSMTSTSTRGKHSLDSKGNKHRKRSKRSERGKRKKRKDARRTRKARRTGKARRTTHWWKTKGYYIAIVLGCALLEYGSESNVLVLTLNSVDVEAEPSRRFLGILDFVARTHSTVFRKIGDPNVIPYFHVTLSWLFNMSHFPTAMGFLEARMPWKLISLMLNDLLKECPSVDRIESEDFPRPNKEITRPLPEDFAQRGLLWVRKYYPDDWFTFMKVDDEERYSELLWMTEERQDRCLWFGCRIASLGNWLTYDKCTRQFGVPPRFNIEIPGLDVVSKTQIAPEPHKNPESQTNAAAAQ
ncbi:hypothetical protein CSPAE12_06396 [Colletotrichum incanum]|nr:hypothetical protein CSPAE12_06396 [Colletotrichum incanum]